MKKSLCLGSIIVIVSLYIVSFGSGYNLGLKKNAPLSVWILGEWKGRMKFPQGTDEVLTEVKIDFIDSERLILYRSNIPKGQMDLLFGIPFKYEYIDNDELRLISRGGSRWQIKKDENRLKITMLDKIFFNQSITLTRIPRLNRLLVFLMGAILIGVYFSKAVGANHTPQKDDQFHKINTISSKATFFLIGILTVVLSLVLNFLFFPLITRWNYFFFFGMPWGAFFILEVYFAILLSGRKTIKNAPGLSIRYYIGVFFVVSGIYGMLVGLYAWINFFVTSCTYTGICFIY